MHVHIFFLTFSFFFPPYSHVKDPSVTATMSRFKRLPIHSTAPIWTAVILSILIVTLTIPASSTIAYIAPSEESRDLSTIAPESTGLVLADPKRKVTDHPVACPFYLPFYNDPPFEKILAIGKNDNDNTRSQQ
jgi:hypothetical protein